MVHFVYSSSMHESLALSIKVFKTIHLKIKSLKILITSSLQKKHLAIYLEKVEGNIDGPVLCFAIKY